MMETNENKENTGKIKIDMDAIDYGEPMEFHCNNGALVHVKQSIPFDEMEEFVLTLAQATFVSDEETGVVYRSYLYDVVFDFLFAKYYTDIDVSDMDTDEGHKKVFQYMEDNALINAMFGENARLQRQIEAIAKMENEVFEAMSRLSSERSSLAFKIKTSLNSVLSDGDLVENISKTNVINEKMIDTIGALIGSKKDGTGMPPVKVGGGVLKFSKK